MAILQISRITHRKGLQENLPQLAGAEFGWSLDERRLFIGNGTIEDGAPVIGNTEILTEFSDILSLSSSYTYKGTRAGYVVSTSADSNDIVRSLQERFDERVSVLSFGATGDGATDDTAAINRAFYELFCRETNPRIRRSLYFPAGRYKVTDTIKVPPYARVVGDGITSSTIAYESPDGGTTVAPTVMTTADSLFQDGSNIGNNGATPPTGIEMSSLGITSQESNTLLLVDSASNSNFELLELRGPLLVADLSNAVAGSSAIFLSSTNSIIPNDVTFDKCITRGTSFGLSANYAAKGVRFENGKMHFHFVGAQIGTIPTGGAPTGVNISRTIFDQIATHGIHVGDTPYNSSCFNVFYDVGNNFSVSPATSIVNFESAQCTSIGDLFERGEADNLVQPRIQLNGLPSIAFDSTHAIELGLYRRTVGLETTLSNSTTGTMFTIQSTVASTWQVDYTVTRGTEMRSGNITVTNNNVTVNYAEDYTESDDVGITFTPTQNGSNTDLDFVTTNSGLDATVNYSIVRLD